MNTFFNIYNITNIILILLSVVICLYCIYRIATRKKKILLSCLGVILSLVVMTLCIRKLYEYYDLWFKIVRKPQLSYISELSLSPKQCREDFKEITRIVNDNYLGIANRKKIDLQKLNAEYAEEVLKVENAQQYGQVLLRYFVSLKNMHTYPFFSFYSSNLSLVTRNDSVWIVRDRKILRQKDLIVAIDGIATADYMKEKLKYTFGSTYQTRKRLAAVGVLSSYTDTCKRVTILRGDSVFETVIPLYKEEDEQEKPQRVAKDSTKVSSQSIMNQQVSLLLAKALKRLDNIGYIRMPHFSAGSVEYFCSQVDSAFKCPYLILNLQKNQGGVRRNVLHIASYLVSEPVTMGDMTIEPNTSRCYRGKLFVLTDEFTSSGGEILTAILKGQSNVTVIGRRTGGDCGSMAFNFKTSHGIEFKLATENPYLLPDGITWSEGEGISPDMEVTETLPWEDKKDAFKIALDLIEQNKLKNIRL